MAAPLDPLGPRANARASQSKKQNISEENGLQKKHVLLDAATNHICKPRCKLSSTDLIFYFDRHVPKMLNVINVGPHSNRWACRLATLANDACVLYAAQKRNRSTCARIGGKVNVRAKGQEERSHWLKVAPAGHGPDSQRGKCGRFVPQLRLWNAACGEGRNEENMESRDS
jgi:hypothetical protein